jgi:hypothetical protein
MPAFSENRPQRIIRAAASVFAGCRIGSGIMYTRASCATDFPPAEFA